MNIAKQLFQLQDIDNELESDKQTLNLVIGQIGESGAISRAQDDLDSKQQHLGELTSQQKSIEWDMEDITGKLKKVDEKLYSGKIGNPKELTDLQNESEALKTGITRLEEQALELMEKVELAVKNVSDAESTLNRLKNEWKGQQHKLTSDMEKLKKEIANLKNKRQHMVDTIDSQTIEIYQELRKQRKTAVAKVQQGTCVGCRISLPTSDLQRVKGGSMVRCSSCGRILFLA
ncbi:zinc ribbon domain-containing protein [Chloroflexota bacterium]